MLKKLISVIESLSCTGESVQDEPEPHMVAALLMLEVSRADYEVSAQELDSIGAALQRRYELSDEQSAALITEAADVSERSVSLHPFLRLLNERYSAQQKYVVIEDMWRVAFADGVLDKYEEYQIRKIADLLYVPHSDFIRAKHRAIEYPLT